jgi:hypothetical protein
MLKPNEVRTPPKGTFDAAQQSKIDELIRESMGRAASSVKAELCRDKSNFVLVVSGRR